MKGGTEKDAKVLGGARDDEDYSAFTHEFDFFGDCVGLGETAGKEEGYI